MILHPDNIKTIKQFGLRRRFKFCTDACYLGVFIRYDEYKHDYLHNFTSNWEKSISMIREMTGKYTQESYAVVVRAIQSE